MSETTALRLTGRDAPSGVEGADPGVVEVGEQLVVAHRDHHGDVTARHGGEVVGGQGLQQLGERNPVPDRRREAGVDDGLVTAIGRAHV